MQTGSQESPRVKIKEAWILKHYTSQKVCENKNSKKEIHKIQN